MSFLPKIRAFLAWARLQDEAGQLSLTTIAFAVGCFCLVTSKPVTLADLSAFALCLSGYHVKRYLQHRRARAAEDHAHAQQLQKRSDGAEVLTDKLAALEKKVQELATPERMEALRGMMARGR